MLLPFKAMLLSERARGRKSGSPPLFARSFKVQRNTAHNRNSGFAVLPQCHDLNAHRVRKVPAGNQNRAPVRWRRSVRVAGKMSGRGVERPRVLSQYGAHPDNQRYERQLRTHAKRPTQPSLCVNPNVKSL
jgi:hypothetical protein